MRDPSPELIAEIRKPKPGFVFVISINTAELQELVGVFTPGTPEAYHAFMFAWEETGGEGGVEFSTVRIGQGFTGPAQKYIAEKMGA